MSSQHIDWSQLWYPGPKRAFTADEMAHAGSDAPSRTLVAIAGINFATVAFVVLQLAPAAQTARLTAVLAALAVMGSTAARWLWWRPWRRPLLMASFALVAVMLVLAMGVRWRIPDRTERQAVAGVLSVGSALLVVVMWFVVVWRAQQIEGRLREQAERERAIEMARRLAAAQVEPHFLFNTLASVQHWVETQDARAAPLLAALTGYLRATLPLFDQPLLAAGQELVAVRRYLEVMHARLGSRLAFDIDVEPAAEQALLPPGLLLTLVENAVVHGIEPQLAGGRIDLSGRCSGGRVVFTVQDNGAGLPAAPREGVGLCSVRQRLALAFGDKARLALGATTPAGCRADIDVPLRLEAAA
jgi:LytS/YehU family sensor histidine kinase